MKKEVKALMVLMIIIMLFPAATIAQEEKKVNVSGPFSSHFKDNGDGTVTDARTGLMWKKCPEGIKGNGCETGSAEKFKWQYALDHAKTLNDAGGFAGHKDWRVPTIDEIMTLIDSNRKDPCVDDAAFPNTPFDAIYWSSTMTDDAQNAACVGFSIGKRLWSFKFDVGYVRLVRGGEKKDAIKEENGKKEDKKKTKDSSAKKGGESGKKQ